MNYKSGDLVKITGNCTGHWFKIGETVRLKCRGESFWAAEHLDRHDWWHVRESDMTPTKATAMPQKIVVTTDGKTTLARLFVGKTMVKRAEAKCAPSDVFDFGIGAELAVKRLMGAKPVTEPAKESDPVKLYCVKSFIDILSAGKIYEPDESGYITYDDGCKSNHSVSDWEFDFIRIGNLVPLVRRPAKVGEWAIATNERGHGVPINTPVCVKEILKYIKYIEVNYTPEHGCNILRPDQYLVLDGYTGGLT